MKWSKKIMSKHKISMKNFENKKKSKAKKGRNNS